MRRIINMTQIQSLRIDRQEQMRYSAMPRQLPQFLPPFCQSLRFALRLRHELDRIERRGIRHDRLLRLDDIAILHTHAHGTSVLHQNFVDVSIELEFTTVLFESALEGFAQRARAADGDRERRSLLEETLEDV